MTQSSIEAEIGLCILFSAVDGEISEKEIGALSNRMGHLLGDDFDVMRLPALLDGELGSISEFGVDHYVSKLPGRIPSERRYEAVRAACVVACADGLAPEEEEVVRQVCVVLEVDADEIIGGVGGRNDTVAPIGETHDDEPNASTKLIEDTLVGRGWVDPMQSMRDAGVALSGFGALALQYESPTNHLLRVEHHTCDGSLHLHVTDESEAGTDLVLFPEGRETDLLTVLTAMQDELTLETLDTHIDELQTVARVCIFQGESLVEIEKVVVTDPVTVDDFEDAARARLSKMAYDYYRSGSDEEHTLRRNRDAWTGFELWYRALVDVSTPRLSTSVLGTEVSSPILIAPTAYHALADEGGERATARASAAAGSLYVASTLATTTLEDVAAAAPGAPRWFQLYVHKDREFTAKLVSRAKAAGYGAIVVTCDTPVLGRRCADVRNGFCLPAGMQMANLIEALPPDLRDGAGSELARFVASRHDASFSWKDLAALASACAPLPLVVKGLVRGDDALAALDNGAKAIWVSNHGGRQLDLAPATADGLVEIVAAVGDRAEVYVDGGIRSGTHALVALGLGARAVFVGRPILWGLGAAGEDGVVRVLALLTEELTRAMQLAGCADASVRVLAIPCAALRLFPR